MTFKEIQDLIKMINKSNLTEFEMKDGDFKISIKANKSNPDNPAMVVQQPIMPVAGAPMQVAPAYQAPPAPAAPAVTPAAAEAPAKSAPKAEKQDESKYLEIKSPIVGTFYRSSAPDKPAFVKIGDSVSEGSVVCIVEAMKLFNEIESEVSGTIVKVMVEDAQPIEYDQVLFLVDPS